MSATANPHAPQSIRHLLLLGSLLLLSSAPLQAGDITLDASSPVAPNLSGVGPGDTVYLAAHTRARFILKGLIGAPGNPIRITNTGGQFVINNTTTSEHGILFLGCQHIVVESTPLSGSDEYGIKIAYVYKGAGLAFTTDTAVGATDFEVRHVEIGNTGFAGIMAKCDSLTASSGFVMRNVKIHCNFIHDTGGEGLYIGASDFHNPAMDRHEIHGVEIRHNRIENAGWDGIQLGAATQDASIHHNEIVGYGKTSPNIYQDEGIRSNPGTAADIHHNWIQGDEDAGTGIFANPYGDVRYYNNVIIAPGGTGIYVDEAGTPPSPYVIQILNNTIVAPGEDGIYLRDQLSDTSLVYNNLVTSAGGLTIRADSGVTYAHDDNIGTSTASAGFVAAASHDYHLATGSPAIDSGTDLSALGISDDHDNLSRPQGSDYDVGAFEYAPSPAVETGIITPLAWGQVGSGYCPATGSFNEQPTWDSANMMPIGVSASPYAATLTAYNNRHWFIDFGPDFAEVRITGSWTRYMPWTSASYGGFGAMWWDDDNDAINDGTTETGLDFGTAQSIPNVAVQQWIQDVDCSFAPITPQGRYLVISTGSVSATRANEFAFSGYRVE